MHGATLASILGPEPPKKACVAGGRGLDYPATPQRGDILGGYSSGQRGQTVNLLAYAYGGSNPSPPTVKNRTWLCLLATSGTTTLRLGGYERVERSVANPRGRVL